MGMLLTPINKLLKAFLILQKYKMAAGGQRSKLTKSHFNSAYRYNSSNLPWIYYLTPQTIFRLNLIIFLKYKMVAGGKRS